jgi:lysozyme
MDLSPIGRAALKAREGERLTAYRDSVNILTIGVGITTASGLITVTPGLTITAAQSDALFAKAVEKYVAPVRAALAKPVPQPFFDAAVSLCYNIGPANFAHSSVVRLANAGNLPAAIEAFLMWNKPAAIVSRRQGERDQAALASYDGAKVYARRGDKKPVAAVAAAPAVAAPAPAPAAGLLARLHAFFARKAA